MNPTVQALKTFLMRPRTEAAEFTAASLFAGVGISDAGYEAAGFRFVVQAEKDDLRAELGRRNFPRSSWVKGDLRSTWPQVIERYVESARGGLDLLAVTPPCQGMSSSNPSRGKRKAGIAEAQEERNRLLLAAVPIVKVLKPRVVVAENVRQLLTLAVQGPNGPISILELLDKELHEYRRFSGVVQMADYGIPQDRRRSVVVLVRRTEPWVERLCAEGLAPWPAPTHGPGRRPWITLDEWFQAMEYEPLDAASAQSARSSTDPLHFVPHYDPKRYRLVADIPPRSGKNAYQNDTCPNCGFKPVPEKEVRCPGCDGLMWNRPLVIDPMTGRARLVKGFHSSYRRMAADSPAPTVTTNSSHLGSDFKIHPWENRVLSIRECADLQTTPRWFDWSWALESGRAYLIRQVVGEALPAYFTYLHGKLLARLLRGEEVAADELARVSAARSRGRTKGARQVKLSLETIEAGRRASSGEA